ncbi:hypothetical protein [Pseudomonas solani]|uniref:hypothetical protein n=1 Tax=Pseudomonas solani TaxID=2731552 RepID=UPI003C2D419B
MRLSLAAAAAWKEVHDFMAKDPDMRRGENVDLLFGLQSAAEQACMAYWDNMVDEEANAEPDDV